MSEVARSGSPQHISIEFVVAIGENGVMGREGALPWRLKSDLKHFKAATIGKPIVMGRKTYLSIGKPLPGRTNIVVTRDAAYTQPGLVVASNLEAALASARGDALRRGADAIAIIGGADIFTQTMPLADRLVVTHVKTSPEGDTLFPEIDPAVWREVERSDHAPGPNDDAGFAIVTYVRRT